MFTTQPSGALRQIGAKFSTPLIPADKHQPQHLLGGVVGNGDDRQLDVAALDELAQLLQRQHGRLALRVVLRRVDLEPRGDVDAAPLEPGIVQQGPADVADPDQDELLELVLAQDLVELVGQLIDLVPPPPVARDAEQGEILADLGGRYAGRIRQIVGEDPDEVQRPQPIQGVFVP